MNFDLVIATCPFLGHTGYAIHSRNFFTELSRKIPTRIYNFVHSGDISYLSDYQRDLIIYQKFDQPPYAIGKSFDRSQYGNKAVEIILECTDGGPFYETHSHPMIAYNVWESTRQPDGFFKRLLEFDQMWVPSYWQRDVTIEQGYPEDRIFVVPEGIDPAIYYPANDQQPETLPGDPSKFKFFVTGRWEPRKGTQEIVEAFLNAFGDQSDVELILNVDNPFPVDEYKTTEQRLRGYGLEHPNIVVEHFMTQEKYLKYLQHSHCFVSCSRAEGWNLPLIEAIACGIPTICSDYGAQLDFAQGISNKVEILDHKKPEVVYGATETFGTWAEPDWNNLSEKIKHVYDNHKQERVKAFISSHYIRNEFTWGKAAEKAMDALEALEPSEEIQVQVPDDIEEPVEINYHFVGGAFLEVLGKSKKTYNFNFYDKDTDKLIYKDILPSNMWSRPLRKWFTNWKVSIDTDGETIFEHDFDAKGKKVFIILDSKSLGDTLAWIPFVEKFRIKNQCKVVVSTFWNEILKEHYTQLEFVEPGSTVHDLYASYTVGCWNGDLTKNKNDWRETPLQKIAADILGVEYEEAKPKLHIPTIAHAPGVKLVSLSEASTAGCKQWQHKGGWQKVVNFLRENDFRVVVVSKEKTELKNIIDQTNQTIQQTINNIAASRLFMGVSSGPAWLSWALNVPVLMVSGCTKPWNEFQTDIIRIHNPHVCNGCMNNKNYTFDKGDWWWCPTKQDFVCTKTITPEMVINEIKKQFI